jgi:hypothetical protein
MNEDTLSISQRRSRLFSAIQDLRAYALKGVVDEMFWPDLEELDELNDPNHGNITEDHLIQLQQPAFRHKTKVFETASKHSRDKYRDATIQAADNNNKNQIYIQCSPRRRPLAPPVLADEMMVSRVLNELQDFRF